MLDWFELKRKNGTATWARHTIDEESGGGTAFEVAEINADGLLDFAKSNQLKTIVFEQERKSQALSDQSGFSSGLGT